MPDIMLVIRDSQLAEFREMVRAQFESELVTHFTRYYPRECRHAGGDPQIRALVREGMDRAGRNGYSTLRQASLWVGLMVMLGAEFDHDPQTPWIASVLADPSMPDATRRIERVYDTALEYLSTTAGNDCEFVVNAMLRIRAMESAALPEGDGEQWESEVCDLLARLYPQKFDFQGEVATRALIRLSAGRAGEYGIAGGRGRSIYSVLAFMLGSGFDRDRLFPWASRILNDAELSGAARAHRLYRAAMDHIQESLSGD